MSTPQGDAGEGGFGLREVALTVLGGIVAIGAIGAIVAAIRGKDVSGGIGIAYYLAGAVVILIGSAPTGGFSLLRGRWSKRRPTGGGSYALQGVLLGALLIGLGALFDLTRPF